MPELLEKRKLMQYQFAKKLGVSDPFITRIINGESRFSYLTARRAAKILKCRMEHLYEMIDD